MAPEAPWTAKIVDLGLGKCLGKHGFSGMVSDTAITTILNETPEPKEACDRLITAANGAGGKDNITAVVINTP